MVYEARPCTSCARPARARPTCACARQPQFFGCSCRPGPWRCCRSCSSRLWRPPRPPRLCAYCRVRVLRVVGPEHGRRGRHAALLASPARVRGPGLMVSKPARDNHGFRVGAALPLAMMEYLRHIACVGRASGRARRPHVLHSRDLLRALIDLDHGAAVGAAAGAAFRGVDRLVPSAPFYERAPAGRPNFSNVSARTPTSRLTPCRPALALRRR